MGFSPCCPKDTNMTSAVSQSSTTQPLAGRRILVTRAAPQAAALRGLLEERGATVAEIPGIEISPPASYAPLDEALRQIVQYDWLILTSVNGVEALLARLAAIGESAEALRKHDLKICAIGPATQAALENEQSGLQVAVVPQRYVAEAVVEALRAQVAGKRVLLVRAAVARDVIPEQLRQCGATVDVVEAYRTVIPAGSAERLHTLLRDPAQRPHAITFTSSSTARNLVEMLGGAAPAAAALRDIALASIEPISKPPSIQCRDWWKQWRNTSALRASYLVSREKQIPRFARNDEISGLRVA